MKPGDLLDGRFDLERVAGSGGMGTVYRAVDRTSGEPVAIKLLRSTAADTMGRFAREIRVLAALRHPGIVRYIADGRTPEGELWLAMEWLDGQTLSHRLAHGGLTAAESIALARRVAEALGMAHERNVVHRDVKPSNLFLPDGDLERIKVLDFGVARITDATRDATRTGVMIGTPGYMAPEQTRGDKDVGARADVFALGCVLFECLTGQPVFVGDNIMAVLAKILLEDAMRVSELRPDLPDELDRLVARMLAKRPDERPRDGAQLAAELGNLGTIDLGDRPRTSARMAALTGTERRLLCVVLIGGGDDPDAVDRTIPGVPAITRDTLEVTPLPDTSDPLGHTLPSVSGSSGIAPDALMALREIAAAHGADLERLVNGAYVATLSGTGGAGDQAVRAARCALALKTLAPSAPIALATGRGVMAGRWPVGEAIDRAARLISERRASGVMASERRASGVMTSERRASGVMISERRASGVITSERRASGVITSERRASGVMTTSARTAVGVTPGATEPAATHFVRIDEVTAGLLDARFELGGDDAGLYVRGERDVVEVVRTLLGKPTPCVGRDRELGVLYGLFEECLSEPIARPVLVTGPAGIGKSRVRYELLKRIKDRDEPVEIWIGRGDALRAGSPFGMIAPALRRAAGILDGEPLEVRRQKLRARSLRHATAEHRRTTEFLAELVGAPFPDDASVELRAARQDPVLMVDQIQRAFVHLIAHETAEQPLLIVLEDLHWGDMPTVKLLDAALHSLPDRPWMIVALARPEIHEMFPRLWSERGLQELRLDELTRKGSERLVRRVLGEQASDSLVARLVEQAGGNAFYLEELIRASAEGKGDAMPETVLAVVQGRLERLEGDARRVLRAASVFGQRFWRGGVTALLGGTAKETTTHAWLDELIERELIGRASSSRFPAETEYMFRHGMVREGAYAMLTEADARLGHRLAGSWLESAGEGDAMVLAEHFERGGEPARAVDAYRRAAEQALAACDFRSVLARATRSVACGATGEPLGALRLAEAEAHKWCGEFAEAAQRGVEAMSLLPPGGARWFAAAGEAAEASGKLDDVTQLVAIGEQLRASPDHTTPEGLGLRVTAIAHAAFQLFSHGHYELAQALLDRVERAAGQLDDPAVLARIFQARSSRAMFAGDAGAYLVSEQAAAAAFERAGDRRYACMQRGHVGYACLEIGAYAEAESALREALEIGTHMGLQNVVATAKHNLGRALQHQGALDEALAIESEAIAAFQAQGDRRLESGARVYLSNILAELGEIDRAEAELRIALEMAQRPMRPQILACLGQVLLARIRPAEALLAAREALDVLEGLGGVEEGESLVRLTFAEALTATGDHDGARTAVRRARERLLARAEKISDPAVRQSFLERVPENARTLALAH
jgi:tetratricopeptide (TPR) repeat protein